MANFRPAGMSDEEDSDYDGFEVYSSQKPTYYQPQENAKKKIENILQNAIINGNLEEVEEIISNDLQNSVNMKLDSGWTPLMHACFHAQEKIVELLLEKGADPNLHADSVTPIMVACSNSSADNDTVFTIVSNLIDKGVVLNICDKYGQTALMRAIGSGRVAIVQKLLDMKVNVEMRDKQGWTAVFWAVHHNQPEILEMLIASNARLLEVDMSNRTLVDIAMSHEYQNILAMLNNYLHNDIENEEVDVGELMHNQIPHWQDYYPGAKGENRPKYSNEIPHLLYGMNCERLTGLIIKSGLSLRSFLLLDEASMIELGIEMPYERQRVKQGLRNFHMRRWKLESTAGLYARKAEKYSVLDCLGTLGSHLQQMYILEATLQYCLREYDRMQDRIKFEHPSSPVLVKLNSASKSMAINVNNIRKEIKKMRVILTKINKNNPQPTDFIKEKSAQEIVIGYVTEALVVCSLGVLLYNAKSVLANFVRK